MTDRSRFSTRTRAAGPLDAATKLFDSIQRLCRSERFRAWTRNVVCGSLASAVLVGSIAAEEDSKFSGWFKKERAQAAATQPSQTENPATAVPTLRLYHSNAPWQRVIEDLASDAGCTLTLHDVPPGNFTRLDRQKHTLEESIQILNREIEPIGFRILLKEKHLTVLDMQQARSTYRRPVSPETSTTRRQRLQTQLGTSGPKFPAKETLQRRFETITRGTPRQQRQGVVQAAGAPSRGDILFSGHQENQADQPTHAAEDAVVVESVYVAKNRTAVDLAQTVHRSFKSRSDLIDSGPNDLPGFRVYRHAPESDRGSVFSADRSAANTWFTLELDTVKNRIVVSGLRQTSQGMTKLLQRLDTLPVADEPATRIVEGTEATLHVAKELQPELARLMQARRRQPPQASDPPPLELAFQDELNRRLEQEGQAQQGDPAQPFNRGLSASAAGLRGDVTIEAIPDLNMIIIRGNEQDLQKVQEIIDQIEELAIGTQPDIRLHFLNHVNSEALAELLTDVYQRLGNLRNVGADQAAQTVDFVPLGSPNAILILAPVNAMESIVDMVQTLDQPGDPASEVEIFPLKTAVAQQVVDLITEFYEERIGLGARPVASADIRTNTVIVRARPAELDEVRLIVRRMDKGNPDSTVQVKIVPLKQAAADELAEFLSTTIQGILNPPVQQQGGGGFGANQGAQELRDTRAVVLEFLKMDGNAQQLVKSGLLSDVRITGDLRTNSLTVIAPEKTMKLLLELINVLDQPAAAIADIKVFKLENADATAAVDLLNELFATDDDDELGIAISGATDTSSTLVPLTFSFDARTNTVVAIGGLEALTVVEAILWNLDESQQRQRETTVIKLRNSRALDVSAAVDAFVQAQLSLIQIDPTRISTNEIIDQTYIVIPEPTTNTLLISASPRYLEQIVQLVEELDIVPPQVLISALLVEVDLLDTDEWGVELGFQDPVLFDRSDAVLDAMGMATGGLEPGFNFNNQPLGNTAVNPGIVGSQGLSNFALGRTNSDLGFGGLVLSASSDSVSVLIRALQARRNARILSAPKVHALDNQPALIQDGQLVPIPDGVTINANTTTPNIVQQQVGLILEVTPRITPEGQVVMGVSAQKSALSGETVPIFFDTSTGTTIGSPIIDQTIATTSLMVNDGQTVVLGGIIVDADEVTERKVPYLGDLPLIGHAFRFDSNTRARAELLIFLTPHIIHNDADFELVKQVEAERLNFFEHEAEQVHGPLFSTPPTMYSEDGYPIIDSHMNTSPGQSRFAPGEPTRTWNLDTTVKPIEPAVDPTIE